MLGYYLHRGLLVRPDGVLRVTAIFLLGTLLLALPRLALAADETGVQRVDGLDVEEVVVHGSTEVEISQGDTTVLLLRGRDSALEPPPFHVLGRTLVLGLPAGSPATAATGVQYKLTLPTLAVLRLRGSGDVFVRPFTTPALTVVVDGSGDVYLYDLDADSARFDMRGSGDIQAVKVRAGAVRLTLAGSGDIQLGSVETDSMYTTLNGSGDVSSGEGSRGAATEINIIGSGEVNFAGLDGDQAGINIVGSGTARVGAFRSIEAAIMGSGEIYHRGAPDIDQTVFGSGRILRN